MPIPPSPYRRTAIITQWPDGTETLSGCLVDDRVADAILSRVKNGARVPYIIRCRRKPDLTERAPGASNLLKAGMPKSHET